MRQKGFTLVELLVVIAILAVLAGALLLAINPQSMIQKSNDATRMQDLETLAKAINLALADGQILLTDQTSGTGTGTCATCNSVAGTQLVDGTGWVPYDTVNSPGTLQRFIAALPVDPLNNATYQYIYSSDGTDYELNCVFEHEDNYDKMVNDGGNQNEPDPAVGGAVFEVGTSLVILP